MTILSLALTCLTRANLSQPLGDEGRQLADHCEESCRVGRSRMIRACVVRDKWTPAEKRSRQYRDAQRILRTMVAELGGSVVAEEECV